MTRDEYRAQRDLQQRRREQKRKAREANKGSMDLPFLLLVLLLTAIGLVMLFSASFPSAYAESGDAAYYVKRQAIFALLGLGSMVAMGVIDYHRLRGTPTLLMIVSFCLLLLVVIPGVGITVNNATRWLGIPSVFTFQPSEIAKLAVIVYFANSISRKGKQMENFRDGVVPYAVILLILAILLMLEPHLSCTVIIMGIGILMMVVGGMKRWLVALGFGGVGVVAVTYVKLVEAGILKYGANRILMWHDPWLQYYDGGYQMAQSLISIGSGGLLGVGFGKGRQKFSFLPEEHNDFIFAIICEELGLIGASIIILIFVLLILRGFWIALHARDRFGMLLVVGCMTQIALQTFLNMAVVTSLLPATGISLPFFSYGGTALALQLFEMGIVLSVSRQIPAPQNG